MSVIPVHDLMIKDLQHAEFDIIPLNGKGDRNYEGVIPHRHNFFELLIFTTGGGVHEVDFNDYKIKANSLHFVSPSQVHKLKANQSKGFVLCFKEDAVIHYKHKAESFATAFPFYDFNSNPPHLQLKNELFKEVLYLANTINTIFYSEHGFKEELIRPYLHIILLKIKYYFFDQVKHTEDLSSGHHPRISAFKGLIDKHYADHLNVHDFSKKLNLSPNYLNALCKKETGKTAIQLIHERVLLEAKRLLYSTNLSVKEISFTLQFEDVPYFNRFFKKSMFLTPLEYREKFSNS